MRVCTWNIQFGLRLEAVVDAVTSLAEFRGVDLIALQEASRHDRHDDAQLIAQALGPEFAYVQVAAQRRRGHEQANALVWRRGIFGASETSTVLPLPGKDAANVRRVERTLLRAVPPQSRMALCVESRSLRVYVVHLDVIGFTHKLQQFRHVLEDLASRPAVPLTLIAGDLNTFGPPRPRLWRRIAAAAHAAGFVNLTAGIRRTHWTGQKLDAVYALSNAPISHRSWTLKVRASDHLPVFVEVSN